MSDLSYPITFHAEVIEVKVKKAPSLDRVFRIVLETNQEQAGLLAEYVANGVIEVGVKND